MVGGRKGDALFISIYVNGTHSFTHLHARTCRHSALTEELDEAALAVGLVILLLEGALVELLEAEGADKVLRVELLAHGGDAAARDGLLAARAQRAAPLVVVRLAVRLPIVVEEAAVDERREALLGNQGEERGGGYNDDLKVGGGLSYGRWGRPPCRRSTRGARGRSGQRCSSPGWLGHSHHTWGRTCQSSPSCSTPSRPSHGSLRRPKNTAVSDSQ